MVDNLTERRREALRLDLEDQQKDLIEQLHRLSRGLIHSTGDCGDRDRVEAGGDAVALESASPVLARRIDAGVSRLREVSAALLRVSEPEFGRCARCGRTMPFADLAEDATRKSCSGKFCTD